MIIKKAQKKTQFLILAHLDSIFIIHFKPDSLLLFDVFLCLVLLIECENKLIIQLKILPIDEMI
jgi:hypothetical protein